MAPYPFAKQRSSGQLALLDVSPPTPLAVGRLEMTGHRTLDRRHRL